jgi:hypothetical protein
MIINSKAREVKHHKARDAGSAVGSLRGCLLFIIFLALCIPPVDDMLMVLNLLCF